MKLSGAEDIAALSDELPGFDATPRMFLLAPSAIPADVLGLLSEATRSVMATHDMARAAAWQLAANLAREPAQWGGVRL